MKKITKEEAEKEIKEFFSGKLTTKEVSKVKRLAMKHNIKLGNLRKKFCKKCYYIFNSNNAEIRVKNGMKIVKCRNCGYISRWKIKS